jgi:uncharacterized lipoprotein YddW (UPF0748 family)
VKRYDIDGVHIDDYFYPYVERDARKQAIEFPDDSSFRRYLRGGGRLSRDDWRRENVNGFVERLYRSIKQTKKQVKFGISPCGIWRPNNPPGIKGLDAYDQLYADSRKWLANGWCDYLAPQLYWGIRPADQSFPVLLKWWREQSHGLPIWPGIATERIGSKRPAREIVRQIELTRRGTTSPGHIHWSMKALLRNQGGIDNLLEAGPYAEKADLPPR